MLTLLKKQLADLLSPTITAMRVFIPPSLCGCEIEITANWLKEHYLEGKQTGAIMYRHPKPGTITHVHARRVCLEHRGWQAKAVPFAPYTLKDQEPNWAAGYMLPPYQALLKEASACAKAGLPRAREDRLLTARAQHRSWESSLTADERLYIHLFTYTGNVGTAACGCKTYRCVNWYDTNQSQVMEHPVHTRVCFQHRWLTVRKVA